MSRQATLSICLAGLLGIVACSSKGAGTEKLDASEKREASEKQDAIAKPDTSKKRDASDKQDAGKKPDGSEKEDATVTPDANRKQQDATADAGAPFMCGSSTCYAGAEFCNVNPFPHLCTEGLTDADIPYEYTCQAFPSECESLADRPRDMCNCISDLHDGDDGGSGDAGYNVMLMNGDQCTIVQGGMCG